MIQCKGCGLANKPLIGNGSIPADVLILTDAPTKTELLMKEAITGENAKLIKAMFEDAIGEIPSMYFLNSILCRPYVKTKGIHYGIQRIPFKKEILSCLQNIIKIVAKVDPKLIVFCGNLAEQYFKKEFPDAIKISHTEYHLNYGWKNSPTYNIDILNIADVMKEINYYD